MSSMLVSHSHCFMVKYNSLHGVVKRFDFDLQVIEHTSMIMWIEIVLELKSSFYWCHL